MRKYGKCAHEYLVRKKQHASSLSTSLIFHSHYFFCSCHTDETLAADSHIDSIAVYKGKRKMEVYCKKKLLKTYTISLGKQPKGHKQYEGDMRTPEGLYFIYNKNPNSTCHKNLGISYPNIADRQAAAKLGKSPGGDIKIHGLPNGQAYFASIHTLKDWTYGCIAVTDDEVDELFEHVIIGSPIYIQP